MESNQIDSSVLQLCVVLACRNQPVSCDRCITCGKPLAPRAPCSCHSRRVPRTLPHERCETEHPQPGPAHADLTWVSEKQSVTPIHRNMVQTGPQNTPGCMDTLSGHTLRHPHDLCCATAASARCWLSNRCSPSCQRPVRSSCWDRPLHP